MTVTVQEPQTSVTLTVPRTMQAGSAATLTVTVENGQGETTWACPQMPDWSATGNTVSFTPTQPGRYYIQATNNGVTAENVIEVSAAPTPSPTPSPTPTPDNSGDQDRGEGDRD